MRKTKNDPEKTAARAHLLLAFSQDHESDCLNLTTQIHLQNDDQRAKRTVPVLSRAPLRFGADVPECWTMPLSQTVQHRSLGWLCSILELGAGEGLQALVAVLHDCLHLHPRRIRMKRGKTLFTDVGRSD